MLRSGICLSIVFLLIVAMLLLLPVHTNVTEVKADAVPVTQGASVTRFLIFGLDRAANLTDSILLLTISEPDVRIRILQIPRDTYAEYTDRDYKKLNGAFTTLGLNGTKRFLSEAFGVPIDYAVAMDLDCVTKIVDAVGGVDLEIPEEMRYSDPAQGLEIDLQPGVSHLNGKQAEQFLRFRSGYPNADLGRMDAQKSFLRAIAEKCGSLDSTSAMRIFCSVLPDVQTDLPLPQMIRLIRLLPRMDVSDLPMETAPGQAVQGISGAWYYSLNRAGMIRAIDRCLLPGDSMSESAFDPFGVFDREDLPEFHRIYTAPPGGGA